MVVYFGNTFYIKLCQEKAVDISCVASVPYTVFCWQSPAGSKEEQARPLGFYYVRKIDLI
jgi:hypothetical protein